MTCIYNCIRVRIYRIFNSNYIPDYDLGVLWGVVYRRTLDHGLLTRGNTVRV